jgi:hypothetical protein
MMGISCRQDYSNHTVMNMIVAKQRFDKHITEVKQSKMGPPLLGSRSLGTFRSNGKTQIIRE